MKDETWLKIQPHVHNTYSREDLGDAHDHLLLAADEVCKVLSNFSAYVKIVPYSHLSGNKSDACGVIHEELADEFPGWLEGEEDHFLNSMLGTIEEFNAKHGGIFLEPYASWAFGVFE